MNRSANFKHTSGLASNGLSVVKSQKIESNTLQEDGSPTFKQIYDKIPNDQYNYNISLGKKTDDIYFAANEMSQIDSKLNKRKINKKKIWETRNQERGGVESQPSEYNIRKRILEIKRSIRDTVALGNTEVKYDTGKQGYLSKDKMDLINESSTILKSMNMQNRNQIGEHVGSLNDFISENREICMKNILLELMKSERSKIADKEITVDKALKDSGARLESDFSEFIGYTEEQKKLQKEMEKIYYDMLKVNKDLIDRRKKLSHEHKTLLDDIDKTVRMILNLKGHATFVNSVLARDKLHNNNNNIIKKRIKGDDLNDNYLMKEKETDRISEGIIEEFSYIQNEEKEFLPEILKDPSMMTDTFAEIEDNILKLINTKQDFEKDTEKLKYEHSLFLRDLEERERQHRQEEDILRKERMKDEVVITLLRKNSDTSNEEAPRLIKDLYTTILGEFEFSQDYLKNLKKKTKTDLMELTREITNTLRDVEGEMNNCISEMELYHNQKGFYTAIDNRKLTNKLQKQLEGKRKAEEMSNERRLRAEERMKRIIIKGRGVISKTQVCKSQAKIDDQDMEKNKNDENEMITYD